MRARPATTSSKSLVSATRIGRRGVHRSMFLPSVKPRNTPRGEASEFRAPPQCSAWSGRRCGSRCRSTRSTWRRSTSSDAGCAIASVRVPPTGVERRARSRRRRVRDGRGRPGAARPRGRARGERTNARGGRRRADRGAGARHLWCRRPLDRRVSAAGFGGDGRGAESSHGRRPRERGRPSGASRDGRERRRFARFGDPIPVPTLVDQSLRSAELQLLDAREALKDARRRVVQLEDALEGWQALRERDGARRDGTRRPPPRTDRLDRVRTAQFVVRIPAGSWRTVGQRTVGARGAMERHVDGISLPARPDSVRRARHFVADAAARAGFEPDDDRPRRRRRERAGHQRGGPRSRTDLGADRARPVVAPRRGAGHRRRSPAPRRRRRRSRTAGAASRSSTRSRRSGAAPWCGARRASRCGSRWNAATVRRVRLSRRYFLTTQVSLVQPGRRRRHGDVGVAGGPGVGGAARRLRVRRRDREAGRAPRAARSGCGSGCTVRAVPLFGLR